MVDIKNLKENDIQIIDETHDYSAHLRINMRIRPQPKPRETQKTRFVNKRVRDYRKWANNVSELLKVALLAHFKDLPVFHKDIQLGIAFGFGAKKEAPADARITKKGKVDKRQIKGIDDWDMSNLIKGIEDIMNGTVYHDDKQIRWYGPCFAEDMTSNWISIHVWRGKRWDDKWDKKTVYSILQWMDSYKK